MGERVSEIVHCDGCGAMARRRVNRPCPDHWFYIESVDRTTPQPRGHARVYIVWACSEACRDAALTFERVAQLLWKKGPGAEIIDEGDTKRWRESEADRG